MMGILSQQNNCLLVFSMKTISHTLAMSSISIITLISFDRCIAVLSPFRHRVWNLTRQYVFFLVTLQVFYATILVAWITNALPIGIARITIIAVISMACCTIAVCYVLIYRTIKAKKRAIAHITTQNTQQHGSKRSVKTSAIIVLGFIVCCSPRIASFLIKDKQLHFHAMQWSGLLVCLNSILNPAIYFLGTQHLRKESSRIMQRMRQKFSKTEDA